MFFDINSRNTFNQPRTLFSPPKNTEWPKWLTLPIHYQPGFRYIKTVTPRRNIDGLEYFQCQLNCEHDIIVSLKDLQRFSLVGNIKVSCKECGGTGEIK